MSAEPRSPGTLGDLLASRRRRRFVGRAAEVELFRSAIDGSYPPWSVLYLHGPGGVGKTSLLEVFADLAVEAGARVARLDGRDLPSSTQALLDALGEALAVPSAGAPIPAPPGGLVVLIDSYERLADLDDWVRGDLVPRLPATALTVLAGRTPPGPLWREDPGWHDLLQVVPLGNLSPEDSRRYLDLAGIDPGARDRLVELTHGHPLGLSLLADVASRGGVPTLDPPAPDVVEALLRRFLDVAPSPLERRALEVCALARVTTEALLREALDVDDAHSLFEVLRELSFVESGPDGVLPHDLARDALAADLRWRDPEAYKQVFRRVRAHFYDALRSSEGIEQQRAIFDLKFLFRNLPSVLSPVDWDAWGEHYPEPARPGDHPAILELVEAWEGAASAAIAAHWLDRQPHGFFVLRAHDGAIRGFLGLLDLSAASGEDRAADPGAEAAWGFATRRRAPRRGERVTQTRFIIDRDAYQGPSPTLNATPVVTIQRFLKTPSHAWDFLTMAEPERWDDYFALADMPRAAGADFVVASRRYGLYAHDFRQVPIDELIELWTERALAQESAVARPEAEEPLALSQPEFEDAVRQALRDLRRPDLLARNPLLRARVAAERARQGASDAALLEGLVREAIDTLRHDPRDDKLWQAVEATYVRSARTQEAAAARLGLPFSTYRRHLSRGVARVVAALWEREAQGPLH